MPMRPETCSEMLAVIDCLYAAALDPAQWKPFLAAAASMFGADNAYVSESAHDNATLEHVMLHPLNWDAISVSRYIELMEEDPRMPAFRSNPYRPQHCRMVVSEKRLHASRTYKEALKPLGIEYTMVVGIPGDNDITKFLGFTRKQTTPAFKVSDCDLMSTLVPHLARSFAIRRALDLKVPAPAILLPASVPRCAETTEDAIRRLLGLSPSHARLTALLMTGRNVKEIAIVLSITEGSTRQYLRQIFKKTSTRRQADLIRVVGHALMQNS